GQTTGTIRVAVTNDNLNEDDETFTIASASASATSTGEVTVDGGPQNFTIPANDPITVAITRQGSASRTESAGNVNFRVALTGGIPSTDVTVPFSVGGTGITAADYDITGPGTPTPSATSHTVTIAAAGATATETETITIAITDDDLNEASETLTVTGTAAGSMGLRVGAGGGAIAYTSGGNTDDVEITDNDAITVTLADATDINEGATANFAVRLDHASAAAVTVGYTVTAGGANAPPFTDAGSGSITIAQGQNSGMISITASATSSIDSGTGTLTVALTTHTAAGTITGTGSQSVTVTFREFDRNFSVAVNTASGKTVDRDMSAGGVQVNESDTVYFTVTLTGSAPTANATVRWAANGETTTAALSGGTLTFTAANWQTAQEVSFVATQDTINEGDETLGVTLSNASGGGGLGVGIATGSASVTVSANDPITYAIEATEGGTEADPGGAAVTVAVTVTLSGATESDWTNIRVPFSVSSSSTAGSGDYTISASPLTFTGTSNETQDITVTITADQLNEASETVIIDLGTATGTGSGGGVLTQGTAQSTVTITDDDTIAATFSAATAAINEGQMHTVTVNLDHASAAATTVNYSIAQGGANNPPFTHSGGSGNTGSFTIAAGATTGSFTVTSTPTNTINSGTGTLTVSFGTVSTGSGGGMAGGTGQQVLTVTFREFERFFVVSADDANTTEGDTVVFTVGFASGGSPVESATPATVTWTLSGVHSSDYSAPASNSGSLSFANNNDQTVRVTVARDNLNEPAETLTLTLTSAAGGGGTGTGITTATADVTIAASDPIAYHLSGGGRVAEGDSGDAATMARFTVNFNVVSAADVTLPFTLAGSATGGAASSMTRDYTNPSPLSFTVAAGDRTANIDIALNRDDLNEADETIELTIDTAMVSVATGGGTAAVRRSGDETLTATITDDDDITVTIAADPASDADDAVAGVQVNEGGDVAFTVTLSGTSDAAIVVPYSFNTLRIPATDSGNGSITIAAGGSSGTFTLSIPSNANVDSGSQQLTVRLGAVGPTADGRGVRAGPAATVTVNYQEFDRNFSVAVNTAASKTVDRDPAAAGIQVSEGDTVYFLVSLAGMAPVSGNDATVDWAPTGAPEGTADTTGATLTFTDSNWQTAQEVTVVARASNDIAEADAPLGVMLTVSDSTVGGGNGTGVATANASVTVVDDDVAGLTISVATLTVNDGSDDGTYSVALTSQPATSPATVTLTSSNALVTLSTALTTTPATTATLEFTDSNWQTAQTVTLTAGNTVADIPVTITHTVTGSAEYASVSGAVAVTVDAALNLLAQPDVRNPNAGISMGSPRTETAGQTVTYPITLGSRPGGSVTLTFSISGGTPAVTTEERSVAQTGDEEPIIVSGRTLTFTDANWNMAQNVVVEIPERARGNYELQAEVTTGTSGRYTTGTTRTLHIRVVPSGARQARMTTMVAALGRAVTQMTSAMLESRIGVLNDKSQRMTLSIGGKGVSEASEDDFAAASGAWAANPFERGQMMSETFTVSGGEAMSSSEILRATSFNLNGGPGGMTVWGGSRLATLKGDYTALDYDGDIKAYQIGMEARGDDGLFGLGFAHSEGDMKFTDRSSPTDVVSGRLQSRMFSLHPYLARRLSESAHVWGTLGYGRADVDLSEGADSAEAGMNVLMGALGATGTRDYGRGYDLRMRLALSASQSRLDAMTLAGNEVRAVNATSVRVAGEWEFGYTQLLHETAGSLRLFGLGGVRKDFEDAEQDAALDIGGGFTLQTDEGLSLNVRATTQVNNTEEEERTLAMDVGYNRHRAGFAPFSTLSMNDDGDENLAAGIKFNNPDRRLGVTLQATLSDSSRADWGQFLSGEWRF
ncbi:MAG: hypothetical protein OXU94_02175, partial [Gammaproteobacteria bacterium]|nr:hypothetical protein [Gammaproteobacteria bacterium]